MIHLITISSPPWMYWFPVDFHDGLLVHDVGLVVMFCLDLNTYENHFHSVYIKVRNYIFPKVFLTEALHHVYFPSTLYN